MLGRAARGMGGLPQEKEVKDGKFCFSVLSSGPGILVCIYTYKKPWLWHVNGS